MTETELYELLKPLNLKASTVSKADRMVWLCRSDVVKVHNLLTQKGLVPLWKMTWWGEIPEKSDNPRGVSVLKGERAFGYRYN